MSIPGSDTLQILSKQEIDEDWESVFGTKALGDSVTDDHRVPL